MKVEEGEEEGVPPTRRTPRIEAVGGLRESVCGGEGVEESVGNGGVRVLERNGVFVSRAEGVLPPPTPPEFVDVPVVLGVL